MRKPVIVTTAIDNYRNRMIAINPDDPIPRVGESVATRKVFDFIFREKRLPTNLEVTTVIHAEEVIIVKVHFSKIQLETFKACDIRPFD